MKKALLFFIVALMFSNARAGIFNKKAFFVSLKSDKVNLRTGPGTDYPIKFTYRLKNFPIKVTGEYENWYKISDKDGDEGWINKNLTSKRKTGIIIGGTQILFAGNNRESRPLNRLEEDLVVRLLKCKKGFCKVKASGRKGWVEEVGIWGSQ